MAKMMKKIRKLCDSDHEHRTPNIGCLSNHEVGDERLLSIGEIKIFNPNFNN